jgi:hypothetical protein
MFTSHLTDDVMQPALDGQPGIIHATMLPFLTLTAHYLVAVNLLIACVQVVLGICMLTGKLERPALAASILWSFMVWYGGEGLCGLLTGQSSALTGAPGPVLLYALLAFAVYPGGSGALQFLSRPVVLRRILAGFWILAAVLQLQPAWWQSGAISQVIAANQAPGTLNGRLLDPMLTWLSGITSPIEAPLNIGLIGICLALAFSLLTLRVKYVNIALAGSITASTAIWVCTQGCGLLLTGGSTDVNLGPLLVLLALVCWNGSIEQRVWSGEKLRLARVQPLPG